MSNANENAPIDFVAQMDQAQSGMKDVARITAAFYQGLLEHGVLADAAAQITASYFEYGYATHVEMSEQNKEEE